MTIEKSKLIVKTFDGSMKKLNILPKNKETKIELEIDYYDDNDKKTNAMLSFDKVIAIDFRVNYFESCIGSELGGFYEIFDKSYKIQIIEDVFQNRLNGYLYHGDYNYDAKDEHDSLNYRYEINEIMKCIDSYHVYQQQIDAGILLVVAKAYTILNI